MINTFFNRGKPIATKPPNTPIKGLHIQIEGNQYLTYYPQPDITAHELALLIVMWPFFSAGGFNNYDYETYINSNNLTRHFKQELK